MTHDELMAEITSESADIGGAVIKALRAVVELHKPNECSHGNGCLECGGMECATGYPCPTVRTIIEELK